MSQNQLSMRNKILSVEVLSHIEGTDVKFIRSKGSRLYKCISLSSFDRLFGVLPGWIKRRDEAARLETAGCVEFSEAEFARLLKP